MNYVAVIGNLTRDVELTYTPSGTARSEFAVAVNRVWMGKDGHRNEDVDFVPVTVWDKQAEHCEKYLHKGSKVAVEGRLDVHRYKPENAPSKTFISVIAQHVEFLSPKKYDTITPPVTTESKTEPPV